MWSAQILVGRYRTFARLDVPLKVTPVSVH